MEHQVQLKNCKFIKALFMVVVLVFTLSADAKSKKKRKRKSSKAQWGFVLVDGAAVYQVPNFDSPILEYLDREKKIRISKKIYNGIGGLGAFYKVRLGKKRYGYITDVDVKIPDKPIRVSRNKSQRKQSPPADGGGADPFSNQLSDAGDVLGPQSLDSVYFTRYLGLAFGSYNYSEEIGGRTESGATSFFGFKMTGPGAFLGGAPMDLEVMYASKPSFYDDVFAASSGFLLLMNTLFILPAYESGRFLIYYGAGVVVTYSSFKVNTLQQPDLDALVSEEVRAGLAFSLGTAYGLGKNWALRAEAKYFYEKEKYLGFNGGLQYRW